MPRVLGTDDKEAAANNRGLRPERKLSMCLRETEHELKNEATPMQISV
jgi:hypothetical protein